MKCLPSFLEAGVIDGIEMLRLLLLARIAATKAGKQVSLHVERPHNCNPQEQSRYVGGLQSFSYNFP